MARVVYGVAAAAQQIAAAITEQAESLRIVIDGPSGSGKTTLAEALADELAARLGPASRPLVLNVEDWTPGWDGLAAADPTTRALISGKTSRYRRWDWMQGDWAGSVHPGSGGWVPVDPTADWIIEGCGALTPQNAAAASVSVWVHTDPATAKSRGIAREGDQYAPFWDQWHAQECAHWEKHHPWSLADFVVET